MSKYTFISHRDPENRFDVSEVTFVVDSCSLSDLLEQFARFLGAAGFSVGPSDELELWTAADQADRQEPMCSDWADEDGPVTIVDESFTERDEAIFKHIDDKQVISTTGGSEL